MAARDDEWFTRLYETHVGAIGKYFLRRASREDVEDLTADVFATAWRRREDMPPEEDDPSGGLAWLYRTAGLLLANHRRKMTALPVEHLPEGIDESSPEMAAIEDDAVRRALAGLAPRDQSILLLAAWDGLTPEQLARVLGISRGGADAALSRARARLRAAWAD